MANHGPAITTNQTSGGGASVNRFQGNLTYPLSLLSLTGRSGLDVDLTASYRSDVQAAVALDNLTAPTGILGLGWDLPFDQVTVQSDGTCSLHGNSYQLTAGGSGGALVATGEVTADADGQPVYRFALAQYQFWRISYFAAAERWEVVQPSGVTYVYGSVAGERGGVQWGLAYGNWTGTSSNTSAQRYPLAWNLVEVRNRWGDAIRYRYLHDDVALEGGRAGDGPTYTRASYLHRIVDATGRVISLDYGDKQYDPAAGLCEYQPPHLDPTGQPQPAYQARYETRYLRSIEVAQPPPTACVPTAPARTQAPVVLYRVHLGYQLVDAAGRGDPGRGALVKRYLTAMSRISGDGVGGPVTRFSYQHAPSTADAPVPTGSLIGVTTPSGTSARYDYQQLALAHARTVQSVAVTGTPGVWFGNDFAVVTALDDGELAISAYTWTGTWQPWARASTLTASVSGDSLMVVAGSDWFALSWTDTAASPSDHVYLYRRDPDQLGTWLEDHYLLPRTDTTTPTVIAAGAAFVTYACPAWSGGDTGGAPVVAFARNGDGGWDQQALAMSGTGAIAVTGTGAYFALARYDADGETMAYQLYYYDQFRRALVRGSQWSTALTLLIDPAAVPTSSMWNLAFFSPGPTYVACTYLTAVDVTAGTQTYAIRIYDWTSDFAVDQDQGAYTTAITVDLDLDLPALLTRASPAQIGNCNLSVRFDGERWHDQTVPLDVSAGADIAFAYGSDLLLATRSDGSLSAMRFDPTSDGWVATGLAPPTTSGSGPAPALISGGLATIGRTVYQQGTDATWHALGDLPSTTSSSSVRVCGQGLITFEEGTGTSASARIAVVVNGQLIVPGSADQAPLTGQRFIVDDASGRGTSLVGAGMFATYPAATSFTSARTLLLHKLVDQRVDQPLTAFAVVGITVDDGVQRAQTRWWYDTATATYSAAGRMPQYSTVWSFAGDGQTPDDAGGGATEYRYYNGLAPEVRGMFYPDRACREHYSQLNGATLFQRGYQRTDDGALAFRTFSMNCTAFMDGPAAGTAWSRVGRNLTASELAVAFAIAADSATVVALDSGTVPATVSAGFTAAGYVLSPALTLLQEVAGARWIVVDDGGGACYFLWLSADRTSIECHAGTSRIKAYQHDPGNGLVARATTWNQGRDGSIEIRSRALRYGATAVDADGKPIYPGMQAAHFLTGLLEVTTTTGEVVTAHRALTWRDDWGDRPGAWAAAGFYQARTTTAAFSWTATPDPADWKSTRTVIARDRHGQVIERQGASGTPRSTLFDAAGINSLVSFTNGSRSAGEVVYLGFQPYEDTSAWTLGGAPSLAAGLARGDSHTGVQALALAPGQTAATGLASAWIMTPRQTSYALSCWVKPAAAVDAGAATFTITVSQGGATVATAALDLGGPAGVWSHRGAVVTLDADLVASPVTVALTAVNASATTTILLDDLLFAPVIGQAKAQSYDPLTRLSTAQVSSRGLTQHLLYDPLHKIAAASARDHEPAGASVIGSGRRAGGGTLDPTAPSFAIALQPGGGGVLETFGDGDAWQHRWQSRSPSGTSSAGWSSHEGALRHRGGTADDLVLRAGKSAPARTAITVQARIAATSFLTAPVELALGTAVAIRWTPGAGASDPGTWTLVDPSTGAARAAAVAPGPLFTLDARSAPIVAAAAKAGTVTAPLAELLAAHGLALSAQGATITATGAGRWRIDDPGRWQRYALATTSTSDGDGDNSDGTDRGLTVTRLTLDPSVWVLIATPGAALFYAGGLAITSALLDLDLTGAPTVTATDDLALGFLSVLFDPTISIQYLTGAGAALQQQVLDGTTLYVQGTLCDSLGRPIADTKVAAMAATLPGYRTGFLTALDPQTGAMGGEIAAYYAGQDGRSDDGGYPFRSFAYERAPTGRVVEQGNPGRDFAIDLTNPARPTTRFAYSADGAGFGLPAGGFQVVVRTDPNGNRVVQLADRLGTVVQAVVASDPAGTTWRTASLARTFSASGSRTTQALPVLISATTAAPTTAPAVVTQDLTLLGQVVSTSRPGHGTRTFAYDQAGKLRFQQDEVGRTATTPYVQYAKYDGLGRLLELGATAATWDQVAAHADDPSWPDEPATWHRRNTWGTDGADPCALGRLIQVETNHGDTGTADVVETYRYDLAGDLIASTQCLPGTDDTVYTTRYQRDGLGRARTVVYPDGDAATGRAATTVHYQFDGRGNLAGVGRSAAEPTSFARYTYDANGVLASETLLPDSAGTLARTWTVNGPGWPTAVTDPLTAETTSYTSGGLDDAGYYDGAIAARTSHLGWTGAPADRADRFAHDGAGWLTQTDDAAGDLDTWGHDASGNLTAIDGAACSYQPGTDRLLRLPGSTSDDFTYDGNGNVTAAGPRGVTSLAYDPVTQLPSSLALDRAGATTTAAYWYGAQQRRLYKTVTTAAGTTRKLYVRASNQQALLERTTDASGSVRTQVLIYGPRGLAAVIADGAVRSIVLDRLGSVIAVADDQAQPVAGFQYDTLGNLTTWGDPTAVDYRFTGQELDAETGLYNYNLRLYDPALGRFYSPDPAAEFPSLYLYAANDPLRYVDPSGAMSARTWFQIGFIVLAAAFSVFLVIVSFGTDAPEVAAVDELLIDGLVETDALVDGGAIIGTIAETEEVIADVEVAQTGLQADFGLGSALTDDSALSLSSTDDDLEFFSCNDDDDFLSCDSGSGRGSDDLFSAFGDSEPGDLGSVSDGEGPVAQGWGEWIADLVRPWNPFSFPDLDTITASYEEQVALYGPDQAMATAAESQTWGQWASEWAAWGGGQASSWSRYVGNATVKGAKWVYSEMTFTARALTAAVAIGVAITIPLATVTVINMF